ERERTVYAHLMARARARKPPARVFVVHRLDRLASGLLVFATSPGAKRALQAQFAAHTVERTYLAVVEGRPARPAGTIASRLPGAARVRAPGGVSGPAFSLCFGGAAPGRSSGREPRRHLPRRPRPPRPAPRARVGPRSPATPHRTHGRSRARPRSTARARPPGRRAATVGRKSRCRVESRRRPAAR